MQNVIETFNLRFSYNHVPVLKGIDLKVPAGSIFGFLGPNGAGKSTTIKTLLGLLQVKEGMVELFGKELNRHKVEILSGIGAMVETPSLYEHLSARNNLEITRHLRQLPKTRIDDVLQVVGLTQDAHRQVKKFSTGMKQRLTLAIALLGQPELLILDEPINGLDPSGIIEIRTLLTRLNREKGCTIFLSSHILDEIERICTDVAVIKEGMFLYQGTMQGLIQRYQQERIRIETGNPAKAGQVIGTDKCNIEEHILFVRINSRDDIPLVVNQLVSAGIEIYSVQSDHSDLESSFLEVLQEGGGE